MIAGLTQRVLTRLPFTAVRKLADQRLLLPFYHLATDDPPRHLGLSYPPRTVRQFRNDLEFLLKHYRPIGLPDLLAALDQERTVPANSFLLTFDDGLREIHDVVAPVLRDLGVPATFFLTTRFLDNQELGYFFKRELLVKALQDQPGRSDQVTALLTRHNCSTRHVANTVRALRYDQQPLMDELATLLDVDFDGYLARHKPFMDTAQVRALLHQGFTVGAHSVDHPLYALLSLAEQLQQTRASMDEIQRRFELSYRAFAFPHSDMGVSRTYFTEVFRQRSVDVSFGASGLRADTHPRSLQRVWMEYKTLTASERLFAEYVDHVVQACSGRNQVERWG